MTAASQPGPDYPAAAWFPARGHRRRRRGAKILAIILHSTDGSAASALRTLTTSSKLSAHFLITRTGDAYQLVRIGDAAFHAGRVKSPNCDNDHTIGIELEHIDGVQDWPDRQIVECAALVVRLRQTLGYLPVLSHRSIAYPTGRKLDPVAFPWLLLAQLAHRYSLGSGPEHLRAVANSIRPGTVPS
jgi:N-acetylmuramoyl-L-alanine amidase